MHSCIHYNHVLVYMHGYPVTIAGYWCTWLWLWASACSAWRLWGALWQCCGERQVTITTYNLGVVLSILHMHVHVHTLCTCVSMHVYVSTVMCFNAECLIARWHQSCRRKYCLFVCGVSLYCASSSESVSHDCRDFECGRPGGVCALSDTEVEVKDRLSSKLWDWSASNKRPTHASQVN